MTKIKICKNNYKNLKKPLDKLGRKCYHMQAVRWTATRREGRKMLYLVNWITQRRTRLTPWTINGLFKRFRTNNSQRNSWVINARSRLFKNLIWASWWGLDTTFWEFDPGSGRTLAACLTHASRTGLIPSGINLVANGWVTREEPAFQWGTTVGNDC